MKIVPKFAVGGASPLFTVYQAVQTPPISRRRVDNQKDSVQVKDSYKESKSSSSEDKGKLTEKDLFNMIKDVDGLPNEMKFIINDLKNEMAISNLIGIDTGNLATNYLNTLYKLKVTNQNKQELDKSIKTAEENGSLGEVAITLSGNLMVTDNNGNIKEISLEQYQQNQNQYQLLTNSNLAWLRKYSPRSAFDQYDRSFEIISNGVGFEAFQKLLDTAKNNLGNYKYEESGVIGKEALAGLRALQGKSKEEIAELLASIDGKTVEYTMSQDSNIQNIKSLVTYLTSVLPKRVRVWAAVKTELPEDEAIKSLIGTYLSSNAKEDNSLTIKQQPKTKTNSSNGSSDIDKLKINTAQRWLNGLGAQSTYILNPGTSRARQVMVNTMPITNTNGDHIGTNSSLQQALSGEYNGVLDINHATIGGFTIDPSAFGSIILVDGKINSIDYPCITKANGDIVPNTSPEIAKAKEEADTLLKRKGIDVRKPEDIKKYWEAINITYKQYGLPEAYNDEGEPVGEWRRFGVINVRTSDRVLGMQDMDDNPLLYEITDDATIDNLIQITKDDAFNKRGFFNSITGNYNRFYEGTLWIPVNTNYQAATTSEMTISETRALEERQQAADLRKNWNKEHSY